MSPEKYWRSLEELASGSRRPEPSRIEVRDEASSAAVDRRSFLQTLGASLGLAGLGACSHPPKAELIPYVEAPVGQTDGLPRYFASMLTHCGAAHGVLIESYMGRPIKIEGNPQHPGSLGATDVFDQAAVLQLWDPDRSQAVMHRAQNSSWNEFEATLADLRTRCSRDGGAGLRVLTGAVTSPTLSSQLHTLLRRYPHARWHVHEPAGYESATQGMRLAYGTSLVPRLHLQRATVILSLDSDFLCDPMAGLRNARDFGDGRKPEAGAMSRLYVIEPTPTLTGAMADHRLPLSSAELGQFLRWLATRLGVSLPVPGSEAEQRLPGEPLVGWIDAIATELERHRRSSLIVVGRSQPPWMHALAAALNHGLGNVGTTLEYLPAEDELAEVGSLSDLASAMRAGLVDTLVLLDTNPVYDAPGELSFTDLMRRVPHALHLGLYCDETAALAEWHLPQAHMLESWTDARAFDGTVTLAQPLIAPLNGGRSPHELLAALMGDDVVRGHEILRRQWRVALSDEEAWQSALRRGFVDGTAWPAREPELLGDWPSRLGTWTDVQAESSTGGNAVLEVLFRPDATIGDGRWANNAWLQELPKPLTQLTWGNAALVSPQLAAQSGLSNGDVVELAIEERRLLAPIWIMPGQAARSITLHLGYGRTRAGQVGNGHGFSAYILRSAGDAWTARGVRLRRSGQQVALAGTQSHFRMEGREPVRVMSLDDHLQQLTSNPNDRKQQPPSLYADRPAGKYSWGMSIDLNACIGCKACTIACQAENNIPVVGRDQVQRGREMHWIRVDRYYAGPIDNPRTYSQPVPCMMCEHAPCELVCPVDATVHDDEGLNVQVYNRCVGTRFCSNNCPYKVRRFNFLQYVDPTIETLAARRNPEVSVRRRGVMEKCTYCIQRIETAHIEAGKEGRRLRDGEVVTACQAVCPTRAIRFGDTADPDADVWRAKASPRNYELLAELGTRPRTSYLARIRNPNPMLEGA